jgi:hypothetical protein
VQADSVPKLLTRGSWCLSAKHGEGLPATADLSHGA